MDTDLAGSFYEGGSWSFRDYSQTPNVMFRTVARKAGVSDRKSFHNFRASMCSMLANSGISPAIACAITGHKSANVFKQYVTVDRTAMREQMNKALAYREGQQRELEEQRQPKLLVETNAA